MFKRHLVVAVLGGLVALPACTSGQSAVEPPITVANLTLSQLQFQVGTANLNGTPGINTVTTFRQPNGLSAVLVSTPSIALPFTNAAAAAVAGTDSGTTTITGTPQQLPGVIGPLTTFGQSVGAFSYGFLSANSSQTGANNSQFYQAGLAAQGNASGSNTMPYYAPAANRNAFYVGPPFIANFKDGTLGTTFLGAPSGFTTFQLTPTAGTYALSLLLPGLNFSTPTFTATTALTSAALLPAMPTPAYTSDHAGGGSVTLVVPAGVRETMISIHDLTANTFYTLVVQGSGPQTAVLPANLGTILNGVAARSIAAGDAVRAIAVGFDYSAMEAVEFGNGTFPQAPIVNNGAAACAFSGTSSTCTGQADLTVSNPAPPSVIE